LDSTSDSTSESDDREQDWSQNAGQDLDIGGAQLSHALKEGYIVDRHVRVRTDPYDFLDPPDQ
jgi:hypothetical protein